MDPVNKALWLVETRIGRDVTVDEVAAVSGLSRFHLSRLFALTVGQSIMRYARGRRLSEAAKTLAAGAPDILSVALDAGYGSHEAFTRAFRDQFGVTPEQVRAKRALDDIQLVEPLRMPADSYAATASPRIETAPILLIVGIGQRHAMVGAPAIPLQWQRLVPYLGSIPGQRGHITYGVCTHADDDGVFDYIAGVEVDRFADMPAEFATVRTRGACGCRHPVKQPPTRRCSNATTTASIR